MKGKRKGGRPKGSTKLTGEIIVTLRQSLLDGDLIKV